MGGFMSTFESNLSDIELIIKDLDNKDISLDDAILKYKHAKDLINDSKLKLEDFKVYLLSRLDKLGE